MEKNRTFIRNLLPITVQSFEIDGICVAHAYFNTPYLARITHSLTFPLEKTPDTHTHTKLFLYTLYTMYSTHKVCIRYEWILIRKL